MSTRRGGGRGASWRRDLAERGVMRVKQHRASALSAGRKGSLYGRTGVLSFQFKSVTTYNSDLGLWYAFHVPVARGKQGRMSQFLLSALPPLFIPRETTSAVWECVCTATVGISFSSSAEENIII